MSSSSLALTLQALFQSARARPACSSWILFFRIPIGDLSFPSCGRSQMHPVPLARQLSHVGIRQRGQCWQGNAPQMSHSSSGFGCFLSVSDVAFSSLSMVRGYLRTSCLLRPMPVLVPRSCWVPCSCNVHNPSRSVSRHSYGFGCLGKL